MDNNEVPQEMHVVDIETLTEAAICDMNMRNLAAQIATDRVIDEKLEHAELAQAQRRKLFQAGVLGF